MKRNVAGQHIGFEMLSKADSTIGDHVTTGTPVVYVTGDDGSQAVGTGTSIHKGNGEWKYYPTQAETNFEHVDFLMTITDAFSQLVNVYPTFPQTGDAFDLVGDLENVSIADINATVDTALVDYGANKTTPPSVDLITADMDANSTQLATILTDLQSGGYMNGMIWINTLSGISGTTPYVHGTVTEPVNNLADALTLASALNLDAFFLVGASSIALSGNSDGMRFYGKNHTINLNGKSVNGTYFDGGAIEGSDDGANTIPTIYENCVLSGQTLGQYVLRDCKLVGNMTFAESGEYDHHGCSFMGDVIQIDYGALVGSVTSIFHGCAGNISLLNMGAVPTDIIQIAGIGEVDFAASCVGGAASIAGVLKVTDNSGGAVTIESDADIVSLVNSLNDVSTGDVVTSCGTALTNYDGPTNTEMLASFDDLNNLASTDVNAACDLALSDYDGPTKAEMDTGLTDLQDHGDTNWGSSGENPNVLLAADIATVTSQTEITLASGSTDDDAYNDQSIVLYDASNSLYPSVRKVVSYVGATKTLVFDAACDFTLDAADTIRVFVTAPGSTAPTVTEIVDGIDASSVKIEAIREDTDTTIPGLITALNDLDSTDVSAASLTALATYDAPTKGEMDSAFTEIKGTTWNSATDTLEDIVDGQTAIKDDTGTLVTQVGTAGDGLSDVPWNADWDVFVKAQADSALTDYDGPTKSELDIGLGTLATSIDGVPAETRVEMDANSTKLIDILLGTGTTIPGLIGDLPDEEDIAAVIVGYVLEDLTAGDLDVGQDITVAKALRGSINRFYRDVQQTASQQTVKNDSGVVVSTMALEEISGTSQTKGAAE